jgi:hypothetical protein
MTTPKPRLDRTGLELLLDGRSLAADDLSAVIAAASAPARPGEIVGLGAAMAVFTEASAVPAAAALGTPMVYRARHTGSARRLTVRGLGAVIAGTALSGLAVAAVAAVVTGDSLNHTNASSHATSNASSGAGSDSNAPGTGSASDTAPASESAPTPNLDGLCTAWLSRPADTGKADDSAAFSVLIATAGGMDNVDAYCTGRLTSAGRKIPTRGPRTSHPASAGQQSNSGKASDHPSSEASEHSTSHPSKSAPLPPAVPSTSSGG